MDKYKRNPIDGSLSSCTVPSTNVSVPIYPNTTEAVQTVVTTTPVAIELPEGATEVTIRHIDQGVTVWIGEDENITPSGSDVFPLLEGDTYCVTLSKGNGNNMYAVVDSGSVTIYAIGATRQ